MTWFFSNTTPINVASNVFTNRYFGSVCHGAIKTPSLLSSGWIQQIDQFFIVQFQKGNCNLIGKSFLFLNLLIQLFKELINTTRYNAYELY